MSDPVPAGYWSDVSYAGKFLPVSHAITLEPWYDDDRKLARWLRDAVADPGRWTKRRRRPDLSRAVWDAILARFGWACAYCGATGVPLEREHHVPFSRNGPTDETNIVPACKPCNVAKGTSDPANWPIRAVS